tara:strand:- start:3391 stop:3681 length:291 start_codon:yes stop_codon:yes gene_type:complete
VKVECVGKGILLGASGYSNIESIKYWRYCGILEIHCDTAMIYGITNAKLKGNRAKIYLCKGKYPYIQCNSRELLYPAESKYATHSKYEELNYYVKY